MRTNQGNKPAGLNSLFDALPHARMDQRYECFSAELTSRPFSVSDFRNIFTHHEQTRSTRQGHMQGAGLTLCLALCAQLCILLRLCLG